MDRRSWLWRRKSSEKSPGETESSGSVSSHSERFSDDQEPSRASPKDSQSPEVSSNPSSGESNENMKSLTAKLQAALLNIKAKEDLVRQHAKVAEEAVTGWEKAEKDALTFKQQLEAAIQKNLALEDRVGHLDGALKECLRQLRQAREEQEQKVEEALVKQASEFESSKSALENQISELQSQFESAKAASASLDLDLQAKLEALEKENSTVKQELVALTKELEIRTLERDLSTQSAETASKQHLDSIKKVTKLEAESRRLRAVTRKASILGSEHKSVSSLYVESLTDSQSDSGERLNLVDTEIRKMGSGDLNECEASCSESWASALIAELDQFKSEKVSNKSLMTTSLEIDLLDDFLEMEKLAALPETGNASSRFDEGPVIEQPQSETNSKLKLELESVMRRMSELEEKFERVMEEKAIMESSLLESQDQLEKVKLKLTAAEGKLMELWEEVNLAEDSKLAAEAAVDTESARRKMVEKQLQAADAQIHALQARIGSLEVKIEEEKSLSVEFKDKCQYFQVEIVKERELSAEAKTKCQHLDVEVEQLRASLADIEEKCKNLESDNKQEKASSAEIMSRYQDLEAMLDQERTSSAKIKNEYQILEMEIEQERASSAEFKARCRTLEEEITRKNQETLKQRSSNSNGELKMKQEKELAVAAGKLSECQKTIASLGRQLKSLASLDEFLLDPEMTGLNGGSMLTRDGEISESNSRTDAYFSKLDLTERNIDIDSENGKDKLPPASSLSSTGSQGLDKSRNRLGKLLTRSRSSSTQIEN